MKKRCCLSAVKWLFTLTLKNYGSSTPVFVHVPGPLKYYIWSSLGFSMGKGARPPVRLWSHRRALTHSRECKSRRCPKCWWSQKGKRFRAFFPWLRFGRWLDAGSDSCFGFGCSACTQYAFAHSSGSSSTTARFALSTPSVSSRPLATPCRSERRPMCSDALENFEHFTVSLNRMKSYALRRHQDSQKHQQAVRFLQGSVTENDMLAAPSYNDFEIVLDGMRKGHSMRSGGASSDRTNLMHWCLSESLFNLWRCKLAAATTLCLVRDERKGKLLIRFRGCGDTLDVCGGTLGSVRMKGGSAEDIVTATARALRIFCTKNFQPPRLGKGLEKQGGFDCALFKHLRSIVYVLTTDSHPAELLASNIMKGNRKSAEEQHNRDPFLPNVVLIGRAGAHASTRLVKRPWQCIDLLKESNDLQNNNKNNMLKCSSCFLQV